MYEENIAAEEVKTTNPQDSQVVNDKPKKKFHFNWKKFIGYFVLGLIVLGIGYLGYRFYEFKPYRVIVSNVTSRSATISWVTDNAEPGMVVYKEGNTVLPIWISKYGMGNGYDDRDYSNAELEAASKTQENISESGDITADDIETEIVVTELGTYWSHHVTIRNLDPETEYEFMVGDGLVFEKAKTVDTENNIVTTLQEDDEIRTPVPAYGIVRYYDDEDEIYIRSVDAIVYVILKENLSGIEAQTISSSMNMDGGWYVDLSTAVTSSGENFWDVLGDVEVSDVNLELIIENVGFGRWAKTISIFESAPADTIDFNLENIENIDNGLEYKGFSIVSQSSFIDLTQRTFAMNLRDGDVMDDTSVFKNIDKTNKSDIAKKIEENLDKYKKEKQKEILKEIENSKNTPVPVTSGGTSLDTSYIQKARGTCGTFDVCEPSTGQTLQCGWFNNSSCNCKCSNKTTGVEWGGTCSCDSSGNPVVTEKDSSITTTIDEENWVAKTPENICSNDLTNASTDARYTCLSSNGCWYSEGYYSRRTYADTGYTCRKTDDGWRWAGNGVTYVDVANPVIEKGTCTCVDTTKICTFKIDKGGSFTEATCAQKEKTQYGSSEKQVTCYTYKKEIAEGKIEKKYSTATSLAGYSLIGEPFETTESECKGSEIVDSGDPDYQKILNAELDSVNANSKCKKNEAFYVMNNNGTFSCTAGDFSKDSINIILDGRCDSRMPAYVLDNDGNYVTYNCANNKWVKASEKFDSSALGLTYTDLVVGQTCTTTRCRCTYTEYEEKKECHTVNICTTDEQWDIETKETPGKTRDLGITEPCTNIKVDVDGKTTIIEGNIFETLNKVYAETKYTVNTTVGIAEKLGAGTYIFEANGDEYIVYINEGDEDKNIYLDVNENGAIDDEDINVSEDFETINVKTIEKQFGYTLKEGFNFISFPFVFTDEDIKTASNLLTYLNDRYNNAFYSISKYDSGKWTIVGSNGGTYDQNDFQLIPGQGYVLKAKTDIYITLYGNEITYESDTDSAPVRFMPGWNLVGLYGTGVKSYTAESILTDITNYEPINFTAVNVSRWVESRALYEALQRDTDGTVYGLDFPIELKKSYFIKVTDGEGNWEPGIE